MTRPNGTRCDTIDESVELLLNALIPNDPGQQRPAPAEDTLCDLQPISRYMPHPICDRVLYTLSSLKDTFKGRGKLSTQETVSNKVLAADSLPSFSIIEDLVTKMKSEMDDHLVELEILFNTTTAKIDVAPRVVNGRKTNLEVSR